MKSSATQKCSRAAAVCLALVVAATALPTSVANSGAAPVVFASPTQAYDQALSDWSKGNTDVALRALEYAADNGVLGAEMKLAELYAGGEGVPQSDAKAFGLYQRIAMRHADAGPRDPDAKRIAQSLVALAGYFRSGVESMEIEPDPGRAAGLYRHAASYFGSVTAQYELARMYLSGEGVNRNVRLAVNWLMNASRKQHAPSQALLGDLLWRGDAEGYHQPLNGLALLKLARERAAGTPDEAWIAKLYDRSVEQALPEQRERARMIVRRWDRRLGGIDEPETSTAKPSDTTRSITVPVEAPAGAAASSIRKVGAVENAPSSR